MGAIFLGWEKARTITARNGAVQPDGAALASLAKDQRLLGIDPGSRTIGLALSDVRLTLATPYGSLKRGKLPRNAAGDPGDRPEAKAPAGWLSAGPFLWTGPVGPAAQAARDWTMALSDAPPASRPRCGTSGCPPQRSAGS